MKKELIAHLDPKSPISEVFRALRTNMQFMNKSEKCQTILITSTVQSEGKSWTAANLAVTFAQTGCKTLLIDADMRKPRQYKIFSVKSYPGLSNYLSGINENGRRENLKVLNCIKETEVENLALLPSGNIPPNPSELLVSSKTEELIEEISKHFDVVIFDGAPCLLVTDSTIISRLVESTILVTSYKYTKADDLKEATRRIRRVGGKIAGVVLNRVEISKKRYENKYYYSSTAPSTNLAKSNKIKNAIETSREKQKDIDEDKKIEKYINEKVEDTEKQIKEEIKSKRFSTMHEVPSDKAKEILENIKKYDK